MEKTQKGLSVILALALCFVSMVPAGFGLFAALCVPSAAAEIVDSGACGENVTWTLDDEGLLTISGTGEMYDYAGWLSELDSPFWNHPSIKSVVVLSGVTRIGEAAFAGCTSLTSVTLPDSVTSIGRDAFSNTAWFNAQPDGLVYAGKVAYQYKGTMPSDTSVVLRDGTKGIADYAFSFCRGLTRVIIPDSVKTIGEDAFGSCYDLKDIKIPNSVTAIGAGAFYACSHIENMTIPDGVTMIYEATFYQCSGLVCVSIPASVTVIDTAAFTGCTALTDVYFTGTEQQWNGIRFDYFGEGGSVEFDDSLENATKHFNADALILEEKELTGVVREGPGWAMRWKISYKSHPDGRRLNPELKIYMEGADKEQHFEYCMNEDGSDIAPWLTETGFQKTEFLKLTVTGTEQNAIYIVPSQFKGYSKLREADFAYIDGIGSAAFQGCTALRTVKGFDESLSVLDRETFAGCTALDAMLDIYGENTLIGEDAFKNCKRIRLRVDANSKAQAYAIQNSIPYELHDDVIPIRYEGYDVLFNPKMFKKTATESNKDLAMLAGMLSWEAENYDYERQPTNRPLYDALGISPGNILNGFDSRAIKVSRCCTIALKKIIVDYKETNLLIVTTRGTKTITEAISDIFTTADSNFFGYNEFKAYGLISEYQDFVFEKLAAFLEIHPSLENEPLKILVTGHSLGGATANLIGARFTYFADSDAWWSDLVDKDDIYVYTFGALDSIGTDGTVSDGYENIHNITNYWDTFGPTNFRTAAGRTRYGKFGHIDLFKTKKSDILTGNAFINHVMETYLDAVRDDIIRYEKKNDQKIASFQCPVDVKIYLDGELVGLVKDNVVDENVTTIPIAVLDDEKYALLEGDGIYTFEITATDGGTMTYQIEDASTGANECLFENVDLEPGKTMTSAVGGEIEVAQAKLYVVDESGKAVAEVHPDGKEEPLEEEILYLPGDVNGDGKVTAADARLALRAAVGLEQYAAGSRAFLASEVTGDGRITAADARKILRASVGLEDPKTWLPK